MSSSQAIPITLIEPSPHPSPLPSLSTSYLLPSMAQQDISLADNDLGLARMFVEVGALRAALQHFESAETRLSSILVSDPTRASDVSQKLSEVRRQCDAAVTRYRFERLNAVALILFERKRFGGAAEICATILQQYALDTKARQHFAHQRREALEAASLTTQCDDALCIADLLIDTIDCGCARSRIVQAEHVLRLASNVLHESMPENLNDEVATDSDSKTLAESLQLRLMKATERVQRRLDGVRAEIRALIGDGFGVPMHAIGREALDVAFTMLAEEEVSGIPEPEVAKPALVASAKLEALVKVSGECLERASSLDPDNEKLREGVLRHSELSRRYNLTISRLAQEAGKEERLDAASWLEKMSRDAEKSSTAPQMLKLCSVMVELVDAYRTMRSSDLVAGRARINVRGRIEEIKSYSERWQADKKARELEMSTELAKISTHLDKLRALMSSKTDLDDVARQLSELHQHMQSLDGFEGSASVKTAINEMIEELSSKKLIVSADLSRPESIHELRSALMTSNYPQGEAERAFVNALDRDAKLLRARARLSQAVSILQHSDASERGDEVEEAFALIERAEKFDAEDQAVKRWSNARQLRLQGIKDLEEGKLARAKTAFELCQEVTPCKAFSTAIEKVGAMEYDSALRIALKGRTAIAVGPDVKKPKEEPEEDIPTVLSGIIDRVWDIVALEESVDEFEEEVRDILDAILYGHEVLQLYKHAQTTAPDRQRLLDDLANVSLKFVHSFRQGVVDGGNIGAQLEIDVSNAAFDWIESLEDVEILRKKIKRLNSEEDKEAISDDDEHDDDVDHADDVDNGGRVLNEIDISLHGGDRRHAVAMSVSSRALRRFEGRIPEELEQMLFELVACELLVCPVFAHLEHGENKDADETTSSDKQLGVMTERMQAGDLVGSALAEKPLPKLISARPQELSTLVRDSVSRWVRTQWYIEGLDEAERLELCSSLAAEAASLCGKAQVTAATQLDGLQHLLADELRAKNKQTRSLFTRFVSSSRVGDQSARRRIVIELSRKVLAARLAAFTEVPEVFESITAALSNCEALDVVFSSKPEKSPISALEGVVRSAVMNAAHSPADAAMRAINDLIGQDALEAEKRRQRKEIAQALARAAAAKYVSEISEASSKGGLAMWAQRAVLRMLVQDTPANRALFRRTQSDIIPTALVDEFAAKLVAINPSGAVDVKTKSKSNSKLNGPGKELVERVSNQVKQDLFGAGMHARVRRSAVRVIEDIVCEALGTGHNARFLNSVSRQTQRDCDIAISQLVKSISNVLSKHLPLEEADRGKLVKEAHHATDKCRRSFRH